MEAVTGDQLGDIDQLVRAWEVQLKNALALKAGAAQAEELEARWGGLLPTSYRAGVAPESAAVDVLALQELAVGSRDLVIALKEEASRALAESPLTRIAFVRRGKKVELAQAMPILGDLGLHVIEERPAKLLGEDEYWIQDFGVLGPDKRPLDLADSGDRVAACIAAAWAGETESDPLNRLVVQTEMSHERLEPLRAYRRYRQRLGSRFTEGYQNEVIVQHPEITELLVRLFETRFGALDPSAPRDLAEESSLRSQILESLDAVSSLDHDRILRNQLQAIDATYRTNAYLPGRGALALKLRSAEVPAMPLPAPLWEIYVHGSRVEGIHLRGDMIARGGLRWSERMDYRTEVLGLMRAQMVKNAVIVPAGAKGGFILRNQPRGVDGQPVNGNALQEAVRSAYVDFVSALLDVTDNLVDGKAVTPAGVRALDGPDTYLVVAADKGTAKLSDTANEISQSRGFWLGDAFASGGITGYDHKALGITARGAWESAKRHFAEEGQDPERDPLTVVGIGDMSGDVFGNGMLLSKTIKLVAAYDHRHVFVDPFPADPQASWQERKRLFELAGSCWADYDEALISPGGGVFSRDLKEIQLSSEIRAALGCEEEVLSPAELIRRALRAPVDMLFNGGIGTVIKASDERDEDAQDRSSEAIRVSADELRARVFVEGGNLGLTQRARVEFARLGHKVNADFIDNSGGVECSDHEVNLKLLLAVASERGQLDLQERNELLARATEEVVQNVLFDSFQQARLLAGEARRAAVRVQAAEELMTYLEAEGHFRREDHNLPGAEELIDRRAAGQGLSTPELAVLVAEAKISVARHLIDSDLAEDPAYAEDLESYFPKSIVERFGGLALEHPLRRQLVATIAASETVDIMGPTFVARRSSEFGATVADVVRSLRVAVGAANARFVLNQIDEAPGLDASLRWQLRGEVEQLLRVTSRWHLAHLPVGSIGPEIQEHAQVLEAMRKQLQRRSGESRQKDYSRELIALGCPKELAQLVASSTVLHLAPRVVETMRVCGSDAAQTSAAVTHVGSALSLERLRRAVEALPKSDRIVRWAAQTLRDELLDAQAAVAREALLAYPKAKGIEAVDKYIAARPAALARLKLVMREVNTRAGSGPAAPSLAVQRLWALIEVPDSMRVS